MLVNGRWLPPEDAFVPPTSLCVGLAGDAAASCVAAENALRSRSRRCRTCWSNGRHTLPAQPAGGRLIGYPWELVEANAGEIVRDFAWLKPCKETWERRSLNVLGPMGNLWIASSAPQIEPMVLADSRQGPVVIDEHAVISAFTRLEGPCMSGRAQIFGAKICAGTTLGPQCRVGGEVEASILHGYANKYHDGFLGHSYVGEWVNFGAGTHNSDLRNDYGEVIMIRAAARVCRRA